MQRHGTHLEVHYTENYVENRQYSDQVRRREEPLFLRYVVGGQEKQKKHSIVLFMSASIERDRLQTWTYVTTLA